MKEIKKNSRDDITVILHRETCFINKTLVFILDIDHNNYFWKNHTEELQELLSTPEHSGINYNRLILVPMFTFPETGNFHINPGRPFLKNGFVTLNQDEMGLTEKFPHNFNFLISTL